MGSNRLYTRGLASLLLCFYLCFALVWCDSYLGCYRINPESDAITRYTGHTRNNWHTLTNVACLRECARFPIAATRYDTCLCMSTDALTSVEAADDSSCTQPCRGASDRKQNEFCGGQEKNLHSVFILEDADVLSQIQHRLHRAVTHKHFRFSVCSSEFSPVLGLDGTNRRFKEATHEAWQQAETKAQCLAHCGQTDWCRAATFHKMTGCLLFNVSSSMSDIVETRLTSTVHDRRCTHPSVVNSVFTVELDSLSVINSRVTSQSEHALDDVDLELDLTSSNQHSHLTRTHTLTYDPGYQTGTWSRAFQPRVSHSDTFTGCQSVHNPDTSLTATDNDLRSAVNRLENSQISSKVRQTLRESLRSILEQSDRSRQQNNVGNGTENGIQDSVTVSLSVPAFHHGNLKFNAREKMRMVVWQATLLLTGNVEVCGENGVHSLAVSQLLPERHSHFNVFGYVTYSQQTVVSKALIRNRDGEIVRPDT